MAHFSIVHQIIGFVIYIPSVSPPQAGAVLACRLLRRLLLRFTTKICPALILLSTLAMLFAHQRPAESWP